MNLNLAIEYIYPDIQRWPDYEVSNQNDGNWDTIEWHTAKYTQPTQTELEAAWAEVETNNAIIAAKQAKSEAINASLWAKDKQDAIIKQINLIASTLDTITSDTPDQTIITEAKTKFAEIKTILNS